MLIISIMIIMIIIILCVRRVDPPKDNRDHPQECRAGQFSPLLRWQTTPVWAMQGFQDFMNNMIISWWLWHVRHWWQMGNARFSWFHDWHSGEMVMIIWKWRKHMMLMMMMLMLMVTRFTVEAGSGGGAVRMEAKAEIKEGEEITVLTSSIPWLSYRLWSESWRTRENHHDYQSWSGSVLQLSVGNP